MPELKPFAPMAARRLLTIEDIDAIAPLVAPVGSREEFARKGAAAELAQFNESRRIAFGCAPLPDARLPIPRTMVGADLPDEPGPK